MPETEATDIRERSVTRNEARVAGANYFFMPLIGYGARLPLAPDPPPWWSPARDLVLRETARSEDMWASAVAIAVTKVQTAGFEVNSAVGLRAKNAQQTLLEVDFLRGYKRFMAKLALDFLLTDNGAFVEIIRASNAPGAKIVGLAHLDSFRCTRTGDDEVPVIYEDLVGKRHELRYYQVFDLVDMPSSAETWHGVGMCAASRVYRTIYKMAAMETYVSESVSGRTPTKLSFIGGLPQMAIEDAMKSASAQADAKGLTAYMGAVVQAALTDKPLNVVEINLKEVPENFNVEQERTDAYLKYANALGIDPQELQPLTGRPLGTATQSQVLDDKQRGKGLAAFFGMFAEQLNLKVLPEATTFKFVENDYRDQQARAQVQKTRADTRAVQISAGEITPQQALQMAVDDGDVPKEFLPEDATPDDTLSDDEKPEDVAAEAAAQAAPTDEAPAAPVDQPAPEAVAQAVKMKELIELKEHAGAMVAFFLPRYVALKLYADTVRLFDERLVTAPDEMHVTLAYLGKAADLEDKRAGIERALTEFASEWPMIQGRINGGGQFLPGEDGSPLYANFDAPYLPRFRQALVDKLLSVPGLGVSSEHGYTPHVTLAYLPDGATAEGLTVGVMPDDYEMTMDRITLAWGGERSHFYLGPLVAKERTLKASRVELVTITPQFTRPKFDTPSGVSRLQEVTKELDAYMRTLAEAAREECPVSEKSDGGTMRDSIGYMLRNRNTRSVEGVLYVGNKERPEVAVRSVLYGRRGFGPKKPGGSLVFEGKDGELVYATHVAGTAPNDWFKRAWDRTAKERADMARRIGALETEQVKVGDVPLANAPNIDGYSERKPDEIPNTVRNRRAGGVEV